MNFIVIILQKWVQTLYWYKYMYEKKSRRYSLLRLKKLKSIIHSSPKNFYFSSFFRVSNFKYITFYVCQPFRPHIILLKLNPLENCSPPKNLTTICCQLPLVAASCQELSLVARQLPASCLLFVAPCFSNFKLVTHIGSEIHFRLVMIRYLLPIQKGYFCHIHDGHYS